jgi:hypothetical protein
MKSGIVGVSPDGHILETQFRGFSGSQIIGDGTSTGTTFVNIGTGITGQEFSIDMAVGPGNKIVGFCNLNISAIGANDTTAGRYVGVKVFADSAQIALGDQGTGANHTRLTVSCQNIGESGELEQYVMKNSSFSFNYTPADTTTTTYKVQAGSSSNGDVKTFINRIVSNSSNSTYVHTGYSSFILMEVKG